MDSKYTKLQIALEIIGLLIIVGMIIFIYIRWNQIPQQIPLHYNAMDKVDNWGSKDEILFLPVISILLYVFLTLMSFFPQMQKIPVIITDENREAVYRNLKNLIIFMKVEILILFFFLLAYTATAQPEIPGFYFPVFLIIVLGTIIFFYVRIIQSGNIKA